MIQLTEVAEFVDGDVVGEVRREERYFVIEIEIFLARTAPPPRALISYCDTFPRKTVLHVEMRQPLLYERSRSFFVFFKVENSSFFGGLPSDESSSFTGESAKVAYLVQNPR